MASSRFWPLCARHLECLIYVFPRDFVATPARQDEKSGDNSPRRGHHDVAGRESAAGCQPPPSDGPVEKWIQAGIDLHRVDELDSMNVFSRSEYEAEYAHASQTAQQIARHSEFPGTNEAYTEYKELRVRDLQWSPAF